MKTIYLDHNATTAVADEVTEAMAPYFNQIFGNASSLHRFGREAKSVLEKSRETIAGALSARPDEIYFTSGGTEADNWAIKGVAYANRKKAITLSPVKLNITRCCTPATIWRKMVFKSPICPLINTVLLIWMLYKTK